MTASANTLSSIAADFAAGVDPTLLARQHFGIEELDEWQREVLYSMNPYTIILKGRQVGASTVLSVKAMHLALNKPRSLILLVSPTLRQSQELFYKCMNLYKALNNPVGASAENKLSLTLVNSSRIVSLPGSADNIRGYSSPDLIIVDEAASIPSDELYYGAIAPMCATGNTQLILASTARGKRGFFYHVWLEKADKSGCAIGSRQLNAHGSRRSSSKRSAANLASFSIKANTSAVLSRISTQFLILLLCTELFETILKSSILTSET